VRESPTASHRAGDSSTSASAASHAAQARSDPVPLPVPESGAAVDDAPSDGAGEESPSGPAPPVQPVSSRAAASSPATGRPRRGQEAPVEPDALQHAAVVGHEQQRALVRLERLLELLDRGEVEVVGRLVEHEHVDAARLQQGEPGAGPLAGRQLVDGTRDVVGLEPELGEQGAHLGRGQVGHEPLEGVGQRHGAGEQGAGLVDLADGDAGSATRASFGGGLAPQQAAQQCGLAGAVRPRDADAVAAVDLQRDRAEHELVAGLALAEHRAAQRRHDGARSRGGADRELELPLLAGLVDLVEARDAALHLTDLLALLLARLGRGLAADLVVVGRLLHRVADALARPLALHAGPADQIGLLVGELVVGLAGVTTGRRALLEVRVVAAAEDAVRRLSEVELEHLRDAAGEELAVVADEHHSSALPLHEALESLEAVEVEVVRGLVEQGDVEAAEQEGGEADAGGLAAAERGHGAVGADGSVAVTVEAEVGEHLGEAVVEVGGAAREPAVEGGRVDVGRVEAVGARGRVEVAEGGGCGVHLGGGLGAAGAAADVLRDGLAGHALVLLRQPADERVAGGEGDRAVLRLVDAGEEAQQRRLAGSVHAHHAHDVTGGDREVEVVEQGAVPLAAGQVLGDE
jgi:hypothetical protein